MKGKFSFVFIVFSVQLLFSQTDYYLPKHLSYQRIITPKKAIEKSAIFVDTISNQNPLFFRENKTDSLDNEVIKQLKETYKFSNISQYAYKTNLVKGQSLFLVLYKYDQMLPFLSENQKPWITILEGIAPRSVLGIGVILKKNGKFKLLNFPKSVKLFTPINSENKALEYICLMESVVPIFDFSFLNDATEPTFYQPIIRPTTIKKHKNKYRVNLFYFWYEYHLKTTICYEIHYQIDRGGTIEILEKQPIFEISDEKE